MESLLCFDLISSILVPDTTLAAGVPGGWQELPLEGTLTPWGRVESIGQASDVRADEGGQLIWARPTVLITLFDRYGNYSRIEPMADRVYVLLNGQRNVLLTDGVVYSCIRDLASQGVENVGGQEVRRIFQQFSFLARDDNQPVL